MSLLTRELTVLTALLVLLIYGCGGSDSHKGKPKPMPDGSAGVAGADSSAGAGGSSGSGGGTSGGSGGVTGGSGGSSGVSGSGGSQDAAMDAPSDGALDATADAEGGTISCDDGNPCTTDLLRTTGCVHAPVVCPNPDQCHNRGTCDVATGQCSTPIKADGTACNDSNTCTQTDTCQAGVCTGANPVVCTPSDQCHDPGTCDPTTGVCDNPVKADGAGCDDGDGCTQTDTCTAGVCAGANPVACTALDQCHDPGTCDPATGACSNPAKGDGAACNDGNLCTQTDTCTNGVCSGGNPVNCGSQDTCHNAGTCDPATGGCSNPAAADGTQCDDGNLCTASSTCQAGLCTGPTKVCTALDACHDVGTCNTSTGQCSNPVKVSGTACDDLNACTQTDACNSTGTCVGSNTITCSALDQCHVAGLCNPSTGTCSNPNKPDGTGCNDSNPCTQTDGCVSGTCVGGNPVVCPPPDQCHNAGQCDTTTGVCTYQAKTDGTACSDGNACTQSDSCVAGACVGTNPVTCTASDQCHIAGVCNTTTGVCSNPVAPPGTSCDDGNLCTQTDTCSSTGACVGANPVTCTALDQCHLAGTCNPGTGVCSNPPKPDGALCNDGTLCTQTDTCASGVCVGTNPVQCTSAPQCHDPGVCDPATGTCSYAIKAAGSSCVDSNPCTQNDTCNASGTCISGTPTVCPTPDQCHDPGVCDTSTGACSNPPKAEGTSCNDGDACTQGDQCHSGSCVGSTVTQCPGDACHDAGTCDSSTGLCNNPVKGDGTACDDGSFCTQGDTCQSGTCTPTTTVTCTASDQCHNAGTCDPATGACSNPAKSNGSGCSDNDACTVGDSCQSGLCTAGTPVVCAPLDTCHTAGTCDPGTGLCSNPTQPDGTSCNDGNACTQSDSCQLGTCTGTNPVVCTPLDQCHDQGTCDPATGTCDNPNKPLGSPCNDGLTCTDNDTCTNGVCGGTALACDDGIACTINGCVEPTGCSFDPAPCGCFADADCDDGKPCNGVYVCSSNTCQLSAQPVDCSGFTDQCNVGTCDIVTGTCSAVPISDGTSCDDGNACTTVDRCQSGVCAGTNPIDCPAIDQCHEVGTCDPTTGLCINLPTPDGAACIDGDSCTQTDVCVSGVCTGSNPVACPPPADQCHTQGTCDPGTGNCSNPTVGDGTACDDGNLCTLSDTCQAGSCTPAGSVICPAPPACHNAGACNPGTGNCDYPLSPDGIACDDGTSCTSGDTCSGGSCTGSLRDKCVSGPAMPTGCDPCVDAIANVDPYCVTNFWDGLCVGEVQSVCGSMECCGNGFCDSYESSNNNCHGDCGCQDTYAYGPSSCATPPCPAGTLSGNTATGGPGGGPMLNDYNITSCGYVGPGAPDYIVQFYAYTTASYTFTLSGSSFDTVLAVLSSCGGPELICNDDSNGTLQSTVTITLTAGTYYWIVVDGYNGQSGAFTLTMTEN